MAWHAAHVIAFMPFTGRRLNPAELNPYRIVTAASRALDAVRQWIKRTMFAAHVRAQFKRKEGA